ncbi:hypothetical protein [Candidatus Phytoplasma ziziphi]|uniref:hypothetical protein n=1 Tax=Candidatus Phytoplasma TaxID=33926 RepID=UPI001374F724|nr:hypothetical protein [Candidatus Phytoplasma ziziphi]
MPFVKKINKSINKPATKNIKNKKKTPLKTHHTQTVSSNSHIVTQIEVLLKKIK